MEMAVFNGCFLPITILFTSNNNTDGVIHRFVFIGLKLS